MILSLQKEITMCFPKPKVVQMPAAENEDANKAAVAAKVDVLCIAVLAVVRVI